MGTESHFGGTLLLVAPVGGVVTDVPKVVAGLFCIPLETVAAGEEFTARVIGAHNLPKTSAQAWAQLDPIYWDQANGRADNLASVGGEAIGLAERAAANPSSKGRVVLLPRVPGYEGGLQQFDKTFTTAEVNAGATIVPAITGRKLRLHDVALIAIGGNAATATSVDVIGTQAASPAKLLAAAVAGLTQNTLLRAGASNATILAAGASFDDNDVSTAITIGHTGSSLATATAIRAIGSYSVR